MSLTINHNLLAANTARNLSASYGALSTSTERLSSGLRINTAADDAAGLAVREIMTDQYVRPLRLQRFRHPLLRVSSLSAGTVPGGEMTNPPGIIYA